VDIGLTQIKKEGCLATTLSSNQCPKANHYIDEAASEAISEAAADSTTASEATSDEAAASSVVAFGVQAATDRAAVATAAIRAIRTILEVMDLFPLIKFKGAGPFLNLLTEAAEPPRQIS
jgi:microcystin-dependent protein